MTQSLVQSLPDVHLCSGRTVPWMLRRRAATSADRPFLIWHPFTGADRTWTYGEFATDVERVAGGLDAQDVRKGDFVIVHMENSPEFLLAYFACARIGAVTVTTNIHSAEGELEYFAEHCGAIAAITQPSLIDCLRRGAKNIRWIACTDNNAGEAPERKPPGDCILFEQLASCADTAPDVEIEPADLHSLMYTSGTTSRPKGVAYTHANILWAAQQNSLHCELRDDDIAYCFLPLFHANALSWQMLATFWAGGAFVLQPKFSASRFWSVARQHGCTWTSVGPFVTLALKEHPDPEQHTFRFWASIVGQEQEVMEAWGIPTIGWYGMTETVSQPIMSDIRFPSENRVMGRPVPEYGIAIVDEDGQHVKPGEIGLLKVLGIRGLSLFSEYFKDEENTAAAFDDDGWFITGDMVKLYEDGGIAFADRDKDMLKVGGENVATSEVERVIVAIDGVEECAVVGKPHEFLHETPIAYVVATQSSDELTRSIEAACEKQLAKFKRPRDVVYVDALPRTPIGKMEKKALRARAAGEIDK